MSEHKCKCDIAGACPWRHVVTTEESFEQCKNGTPLENELPLHCMYLGKRMTEDSAKLQHPVYQCVLHDACTIDKSPHRVRACVDCKDKTRVSDRDLIERYIDPLTVTDREGKRTHALRNMLKGGAAFLVCGGPSLRTMPYQRLAERGVFSLGVNNVAGFAPCSAFVCSDPPYKFHWGIFTDPKVMKFLPVPKLRPRRGALRYKDPRNGRFFDLNITTRDCPNVWGFDRRSWLTADETWFTTKDAAWGNHKDGVVKTGNDKTVNTMLLGIRVLQYLGARQIFLAGVDFFMSPARSISDNYSFGEQRNVGACTSNNGQYQVCDKWLTELRPVFERFGFEVYNCNVFSRLRAFDYVPFEEGIRVCKGIIPDEPFDLVGWYEKDKDKDKEGVKQDAAQPSIRTEDLGSNCSSSCH